MTTKRSLKTRPNLEFTVEFQFCFPILRTATAALFLKLWFSKLYSLR